MNEREMFRWEYDCTNLRGEAHYCRNHLHVHGNMPALGGLELKKLHIPTGWTTFEDVLRFLIMDLGVKPATEDRPSILVKPEREFRTSVMPGSVADE